jgi:hypothetical protein
MKIKINGWDLFRVVSQIALDLDLPNTWNLLIEFPKVYLASARGAWQTK